MLERRRAWTIIARKIAVLSPGFKALMAVSTAAPGGYTAWCLPCVTSIPLPRTRPSLSKFVPPIIPAASLVLLAQHVSQSPICVIVSGVFIVESFPGEVLSRPLTPCLAQGRLGCHSPRQRRSSVF
jgi:hypothetical protein